MSLNGFYVGGPFNCSLSLTTHETLRQPASERKHRQTKKQWEGEKLKHKLPPHSAYLISQPFLLTFFFILKKALLCFCCFFSWCLHFFESFSLERVAGFGFSLSLPKKQRRVTSSLLSLLLNTHAEKRDPLYLSLEGWGLCRGQRFVHCSMLLGTAVKYAGNAWKTPGPALPGEPHL